MLWDAKKSTGNVTTYNSSIYAPLAQLVEQLTLNQ
jgi:hypothetical protein